jgi:anti-anti-sigma factor
MPLTQWSEEIIIAEMADEPAFSDDISSLMLQLSANEDWSPDIIVNMKAVTFLNSSNIAQLLKLRKRVLSGEGRLRICSVANSVWSVMLITGLDKVFEFTDDVATSLASLHIEP